jgi:hypothetical protein
VVNIKVIIDKNLAWFTMVKLLITSDKDQAEEKLKTNKHTCAAVQLKENAANKNIAVAVTTMKFFGFIIGNSYSRLLKLPNARFYNSNLKKYHRKILPVSYTRPFNNLF